MSADAHTASDESERTGLCWCRSRSTAEEAMVRLGDHPERNASYPPFVISGVALVRRTDDTRLLPDAPTRRMVAAAQALLDRPRQGPGARSGLEP